MGSPDIGVFVAGVDFNAVKYDAWRGAELRK